MILSLKGFNYVVNNDRYVVGYVMLWEEAKQLVDDFKLAMQMSFLLKKHAPITFGTRG